MTPVLTLRRGPPGRPALCLAPVTLFTDLHSRPAVGPALPPPGVLAGANHPTDAETADSARCVRSDHHLRVEVSKQPATVSPKPTRSCVCHSPSPVHVDPGPRPPQPKTVRRGFKKQKLRACQPGT